LARKANNRVLARWRQVTMITEGIASHGNVIRVFWRILPSGGDRQRDDQSFLAVKVRYNKRKL
jgi:hypothetical protein